MFSIVSHFDSSRLWTFSLFMRYYRNENNEIFFRSVTETILPGEGMYGNFETRFYFTTIGTMIVDGLRFLASLRRT